MTIEGLHIGVLGPFEVRVDGVRVGPAGSRRRGLLALLALEANSVVPVDSLIDRLWGEESPASAVNLVQTYVSTWRKALGDDDRTRLSTVGSGYRLALENHECDRLAFADLVTRGRDASTSGQFAEAAGHLGEALAMWRGPALVDLSSEPFHARLTTELDAERVVVTEGWANAVLRGGGDPHQVVGVLTDQLLRDPMRESLTELLMWALTAAGRQAEALDVFSTTRRLLLDELGADPGQSLASMHEKVLRADPALLTKWETPSKGRTPPVRLDRLVGRESELSEIEALLDGGRLVTLTGPGGAGKTRLALELLARRTARGDSGWLVELASLQETSLAPATIAAALELQTSAGADPLRALTASLSDVVGLLVLDNLEHLDDVALVVDRLHRETRRLHILVTSREPLRLEGEQQYPVPLLAVPPPGDDLERLEQNDSVQLFVDRARSHSPAFALDSDNAAEVGEIVRHLEGLPLAIEIAAPWLRMLTATELSARLATALLDVPGRRAGAPDRHRTLRDTITWSHDLLGPTEQTLLWHLSVFVGSFSLEAVESICADGESIVASDLFDLVDHNLVQVVAPVQGQPRFRLLATVRDFVRDLGPVSNALDRERLSATHADWYAAWAAQLAANSEGREAPKWLELAVADADNLRAAIQTYRAADDVDRRLQLVVDCMIVWFEAGHEQEGELLLAEALADAGDAAPARAIALLYWAWLRATINRSEAAAAAATALELARGERDAAVEAFALQTLGDTLDDPDEAEAANMAVFDAADRAENQVVRYGPTGSDAVRCGASHNLATAWMYRSVPKALSWQVEAVRRASLEGDRRIIAVNSARLASIHLLAGDPDSSRVALDQSRELVSSRVTSRWEDIVAYSEAVLLHHEDRVQEAEELLLRAFRSAWSGGRPLHTVLTAASLADLYLSTERAGEALLVLEQAGDAGPAVEVSPAHRARLSVRWARLNRLEGEREQAFERLAEAEAVLSTDALPPERVIVLLERAEWADADERHPDCGSHLDDLRSSMAQTGVHLPPWERNRLDALDSRRSG